MAVTKKYIRGILCLGMTVSIMTRVSLPSNGLSHMNEDREAGLLSQSRTTPAPRSMLAGAIDPFRT